MGTRDMGAHTMGTHDMGGSLLFEYKVRQGSPHYGYTRHRGAHIMGTHDMGGPHLLGRHGVVPSLWVRGVLTIQEQ